MNRIIEVKLTLTPSDLWHIEVTKAFAPENGGGVQVFREWGTREIHRALEIAKEMVTMHPARRTDL
jgi:hypothetical protein